MSLPIVLPLCSCKKSTKWVIRRCNRNRTDYKKKDNDVQNTTLTKWAKRSEQNAGVISGAPEGCSTSRTPHVVITLHEQDVVLIILVSFSSKVSKVQMVKQRT